jgi:hypothetical protein
MTVVPVAFSTEGKNMIIHTKEGIIGIREETFEWN